MREDVVEKIVYYMYPYVHPVRHSGRLAVAVELSGDRTRASVGVAFCSPRDRFERARARTITTGRLAKGVGKHHLVVAVDPKMGRRAVNAAVISAIARDVPAPSWARPYMDGLAELFTYGMELLGGEVAGVRKSPASE